MNNEQLIQKVCDISHFNFEDCNTSVEKDKGDHRLIMNKIM
jgi:hypothetical protein